MGAGTIITYITSLKASELAPASRVGLMGYLVPLVGVIGGVVIFDESLTANLALGGLLILAGVTLVGRANRSVGVGPAWLASTNREPPHPRRRRLALCLGPSPPGPSGRAPICPPTSLLAITASPATTC